MATHHQLKCWPIPFAALATGRKRFEYRKNDRGFEVGDMLHINCWEPTGNCGNGEFTGDQLDMRVTYILRGPDFGVPKGYAVMSVERPPSTPDTTGGGRG